MARPEAATELDLHDASVPWPKIINNYGKGGCSRVGQCSLAPHKGGRGGNVRRAITPRSEMVGRERGLTSGGKTASNQAKRDGGSR
jgi:hypothetical protein